MASKTGTTELEEYFIPAKALEHPGNGEYFDLKQKIICAIIRLEYKNDFFADISLGDNTPFVFIYNICFNPENMGYDVFASLKGV